MPSSTEAQALEGVELRGRWGRREFVPFDAVEALDEGGVLLLTGEHRRLSPAQRAEVERALSPPDPSGDRAADAAALLHYIEGSWSPLRAAEALLKMAASSAASDVHLEAEQARFQLRFRLNGGLEDFASLPPATGRRFIAALKHASGCLPYRSDLVQEGRIPREGIAADVRTSFLPTALGERAALRLFGRLLALDDLGLDAETVRGLEQALDLPSGLLLVAGPSGGGKTTTVYAALRHLTARRSGAHLSIEDPVEQRLRLAGIPVDQVELCPERGLTAEAALVGALRQDIDVVALAEVRTDAEASLALQAAHTGRLVVAGIHAGSPGEAKQRMLDLGADPTVLDATLRGVLHQRLQATACGCDSTVCGRCGGTGRTRRPVATFEGGRA